MHDAQKTSSVEQRRKLLKGALAASTVMSVGYSSAALASFQCVTSTTPYAGVGFKKSISTSNDWAWLRLQVFDTDKSSNGTTNPTDWKAVKVPNGIDPAVADGDTNTTVYFYNSLLASPILYLGGDTAVPNGIHVETADAGSYAYVIIYFATDGSITGFYPTRVHVAGLDYPAQGSCLTSLNPSLTQTNILYGG